jgi:hypothetical protein
MNWVGGDSEGWLTRRSLVRASNWTADSSLVIWCYTSVFINVHLQTNNQVSEWTTIDDTGCIPDRVGDVILSRQAGNAESWTNAPRARSGSVGC